MEEVKTGFYPNTTHHALGNRAYRRNKGVQSIVNNRGKKSKRGKRSITLFGGKLLGYLQVIGKKRIFHFYN